ncbi:MAG: hypothetical protein IKH01_10610 [Prevotella sp.]|nr:hypothetical protein [Prevotella sp.]
MEELIKKMIHDLFKQVLEKVPQKGSFPVVYERYENPDKSYNLTHIILKVTAVPVKGSEDERYLEIAAVSYPHAYGAERVVGFGTTEDIIKRLQEIELFEKIMESIPCLARDIEDTAWEIERNSY